MANFEGFKGYLVVFMLSSLFLVSLYSFGIGIKNNYGSDKDLLDSQQLDVEAYNIQLNQTATDATKWQEAFTSDNMFVALGSIVLFSIWGIFKLMWTAINGFITLIVGGATSVLGIDPIVTGTFVAILIIGMIFAVWRVIKSGE